MDDFSDYIAEKYGFVGFLCFIMCVVVVLIAWVALSLLFVFPAFAPVIFVAWVARKYYNEGRNAN